MEGKRKRASLAIVCVALLAILAVAGTVAYLQDSTGDVTNIFSTNNVNVTLTEDSGQTYNIVPGTSETKDPKVTVDNSVDAYAYVKVDDKTEGLVTYSIADGWTALDAAKYPGVYYREVAVNANPKTFPVLKDNKVSYSASLTNDDMKKLSEPGTLTFTAYAIQKVKGTESGDNTNFTPQDAWLKIPVKVEVSDSEDFVSAVENANANEVVTLTEDITIDREIPQSSSGATTIDLNEHTLATEVGSTVEVDDGRSLAFENGELDLSGFEKGSDTAINASGGSKVSLTDVAFTTNGTALGVDGEGSTLEVANSTVASSGGYCVATNASTSANYGVVINLADSTLEMQGQYGPAVLLNVPGTLDINRCTISGQRIAVAVRGGTASITDSDLSSSGAPDILAEGDDAYFLNDNWGSGNSMPQASLLLGNRSASYQYPTSCQLTNTKISTYEGGKTVYIYGNATEDLGATLTYDSASSVGDVVYGGGYAVVNGVVQGQNSGN